MGVGVLGGRVIFRVLCDFGFADLAIKMITRPDQPSYGFMIKEGMTTLSEFIVVANKSLNHHFWGDISALMIEYFAGIRVNSDLSGADRVDISPVFPTDMSFAEAYHNSVCGKVSTRWDKNSDGSITLTLEYPEGARGDVVAPEGYTVNGTPTAKAASGSYIFKAI